MTIMKIALIAVLGVLLAKSIPYEMPAFGLLAGIGTSIAVVGFGIYEIKGVVEKLAEMKQLLGEWGDAFGLLARMLGCAYVCDFSASVCRDGGHSAVAGQIETMGKLCIMCSGLSILIRLVSQIKSMI